MEFNETMKINLEFDKEKEVREIVAKVYEALKIKGYDPISQIVGSVPLPAAVFPAPAPDRASPASHAPPSPLRKTRDILSGDPTYITSYNGARGLIVKIERDELLEEFAKTYIKTL